MNPKRTHAQLGLSHSSRLDRTVSIQLQRNYQLFFNLARDQNRLKKYLKIKYQGIIYKTGECIELYHLGSNLPYIAKLVTIASIEGIDNSQQSLHGGKIDPRYPLIEVEWYYRKNDLSKDSKFPEWEKFMSGNEVFASGLRFVLPVEGIMGKCEVITIDEYAELGNVENSIYFTRAAYDVQTGRLTPDLYLEKSPYCYCEKPYNPDLGYIECEKCKKWFHIDCVALKGENIDDFVCSKCTAKSAFDKKKKKGNC